MKRIQKSKNQKNDQDFLCVIVTGMSGAGKSHAINCLEDFGFFCVDNLPAPLLPRFADLIVQSGKSLSKVAIGVDVREGRFFDRLSKDLQEFKSRKINTWILFFDAEDKVLLRRFSETRRKHPSGEGVLAGVRQERKRLKDIRMQADKIIDTSSFTLSELKESVAKSLPTTLHRTLHVTIYSFGFKYGVPVDADIVWDVRFMTNPFYIPKLKHKTGLSKEVRKYVLQKNESKTFLPKFSSLLMHCIPQYMKEGKSHFTVAIGCTGGRHRSVSIAEALATILRKKNYPVSIHHRDLE